MVLAENRGFKQQLERVNAVIVLKNKQIAELNAKIRVLEAEAL